MEKQKEKKVYVDIDDTPSIIKNLNEFQSNLGAINNLNNVLSKENLYFFNSLITKDNIKINLLLSKIFLNIISKEFLYKNYIAAIKETDDYKIDVILYFIDNCVLIEDKLSNFIFSYELFVLKKKILGLLNYIYNNWHKKFDESNEKLNKVIELMDYLPSKFFSEAFNEMSKSKEIFQVFKSQNVYSITKFEDKFSEINNCFEQNEIFKKFIELNSDLNLVKNDNDIEIIEINPNKKDDIFEFYEKYGILLIKFCAYYNYIFLDKKEDVEMEKEKYFEYEENEYENNATKVIFLINKSSKEKADEESKEGNRKNKRVESLLKNKRFVSSLMTNEYKDLIKKGITFYLNSLQNLEKEPKIKEIKNHLIYFLESLETESYYPLYLKNLDKMVINDNFTQAFLTNVLPGQNNKFYLETNFKEDVLLYIDFYLEDKTKDINFELNQYDNNSNLLKPVYQQERVDETLRIFMYCHGYSIFELVFDNYYSWFNSKDVNFRISYLIPMKDKLTEEIYDNENYFLINDEKYYYVKNEKEEENLINIPVILNRNNLKIGNIKKSESGEKKYEIEFKENKEDEEEFISKVYFNYVLFNYLKKQKFDIKQQLLFSIFSQNNDLLTIKEDLKENLKFCEDNTDIKFIKYVGFWPDEKVGDFNVNYKLYDLDELLVINHKLLKYKKKKEKKLKNEQNTEEEKKDQEQKEEKEEKEEKKEKGKKENKKKKQENKNDIKKISDQKILKKDKLQNRTNSILLIHLYKNHTNIKFFDKGEFHKQVKLSVLKEINLEDITINKEEEIFDLIKTINDSIKDLEIILVNDNYLKEEDKQIINDLIEKIKKYCQENINPPISSFEYEINEMCNNVINYIYLKSEN